MQEKGYTNIYIKYRNIPELNLTKLEEFYKIYDINIINGSSFDGENMIISIIDINKNIGISGENRTIRKNSIEVPEEIKKILKKCDSEIRFTTREIPDSVMVEIFIAYLMKQTDVAVYYEQYLSSKEQSIIEKYSKYKPSCTKGYYNLDEMSNLPENALSLDQAEKNIYSTIEEIETNMKKISRFKYLVPIYGIAAFITFIIFVVIDVYLEVVYFLIAFVIFLILGLMLKVKSNKINKMLSTYNPIHIKNIDLEELKRKKDDFQI